LWLVLSLLAVLTLSASAQKKVKEPKRPGIGKGADTNDPNAYYLWGVSQLERYPEDAADAFYWAIRLNPSWADAYYARWAALHLSEPDRYVAYVEGDSKTLKSAEVRQIDSLRLRAEQANPFLYRKFENVMYRHFLQTYVQRRNPSIDQAELDDAIRDLMSKGGFEDKAQSAYIAGNFPFALQEWAAALPGWKNKSYPHAERGRIFYMLGAYDSAGAEMSSAVADFRKSDNDDLVYVYRSKALYEQAVGMIYEKEKNMDAAREAYGRALTEDLSYAPAHLRLSAIDMAKGDTAGALSEMDIATQVAPNDGTIAFLYGYALIQAGHDAEAMEQLKRATTLEPYYAAPVVLMALVYDASDMKEEAAAQYNAFIKLASQKDPQLARAKTRLAALSTTASTTTPPATPPAPAKP
jgi:tetratricopeptide (TPR) repeat protein